MAKDLLNINNFNLDYEERVRYILIDFPCLFDTDYGVVSYLMYTYEHSKYFLDGYRDWTDYFLKCKLLSRDLINPLTALLKPEYEKHADNLYKEIKEKHWEDILKLSIQTDIVRLLYKVYNYAGYKITVNCRNTLESDMINQYVSDWNTVIEGNLDDKFFCFFVHDLLERAEDILKLQAKTIFIYYHKPNCASYKAKLILPVVCPAMLINDFRLISPYNDVVFPEDMTPNDVEVIYDGKQYKLK